MTGLDIRSKPLGNPDCSSMEGALSRKSHLARMSPRMAQRCGFGGLPDMMLDAILAVYCQQRYHRMSRVIALTIEACLHRNGCAAACK